MQKKENKDMVKAMLEIINDKNLFFYRDFWEAIYSKGIIISSYTNEE